MVCALVLLVAVDVVYRVAPPLWYLHGRRLWKRSRRNIGFDREAMSTVIEREMEFSALSLAQDSGPLRREMTGLPSAGVKPIGMPQQREEHILSNVLHSPNALNPAETHNPSKQMCPSSDRSIRSLKMALLRDVWDPVAPTSVV